MQSEQDLIIQKVNEIIEATPDVEESNIVIINHQKFKKITYTIQKEDTLWKIAEKFYADKHAWPQIQQDNRINDPHFILEDDQIIIYVPVE